MSFWNRLRNTFTGGDAAGIDEELAFHIEQRTQRNIDAGMPPEEARREARIRFGATQKLREETRDADLLGPLDGLLRDARFAIRALGRRPGLVATVVASLALGIGATTLVFSVFDALFLRPLPMSAPDELIVIQERVKGRRQSANPARLRDYREQLDAVTGVTGIYGEGMVLTGRGDARRLTAIRFFGDALGVLGATPQTGRPFTREEAHARAALPAMLTDAGWRKHFGADRSVVGEALTLDQRSYTVIGILPPAFDYPDGAEVWIPAAAEFQGAGRGGSWFQMIARRRQPLAAVDAQLTAITARFRERYPATDANLTARAVPLQEFETQGAQAAGYLLFGAVCFVLLIACLNIALLLIARSAERRRESAIRLAMGAGAGSLARLALMESMGLALAGGALGTALAWVSLEGFKQLLPVDTPRLSSATLDARVLAFALALSLLCGALCGLRPAVEGLRLRLAEFLHAGGRSTGTRARFRARSVLVVSQVVLSVLLLVGAVMLTRGFLELLRRPLGIDNTKVLTAQVSLSWETPFDRIRAFHDRVLPELAALPGVQHAGLVDRLPAHGGTQNGPLVIRGRDFNPETEAKNIGHRAVSPGYFAALGIPLRRGRMFEERRREAVVNEVLAARLFPGEDPIGRFVSFDVKEPRQWFEVTGVVGNVRTHVASHDLPAEVWVSPRYLFWAMPTYVLATTGDPASLAAAVRGVFRKVDPNLPVGDILPLDASLARQTRDPRVLAGLMGAFALVALVMSAIGLFGLLAREVAERTQEIGVRLALGADPGDVLALTLKRGALLATVGLALGMAAAVPFARVMATELPAGFLGGDAFAFAIAGAVLLVVALGASYWPARRAARVDPLVALRHD